MVPVTMRVGDSQEQKFSFRQNIGKIALVLYKLLKRNKNQASDCCVLSTLIYHSMSTKARICRMGFVDISCKVLQSLLVCSTDKADLHYIHYKHGSLSQCFFFPSSSYAPFVVVLKQDKVKTPLHV